VRFLLFYLIPIYFIFTILLPTSVSAQEYGDSGYGDGGNYGDTNGGYGDGYGDGGHYGDDRNGDYSESGSSPYGDNGSGYGDTPYGDSPAYGDNGQGYGDSGQGYGDSGSYGDNGSYGDAGTPPSGPNFFQLRPTTGCAGTTGNIRLSWTHSLGASRYFVRFLDATTNTSGYAFPAAGATQDGSRINLNAGSQYFTRDHQYSFLISALDSSGNEIAHSDNQLWSHQKFGSYTTFPNCEPPDPFTMSPPVSRCDGTTPIVDTGWQSAGNFPSGSTYTLIYRPADGGSETIAYQTGSGNGYTFGATQPVISLTPGARYGFLIAAQNINGTTYANDGNPANFGWSDAFTTSGYGPTTVRSDCGGGGGGGPFNLTLTPYCSLGKSHVRLDWTAPATNAPGPTTNSGYFVTRDTVPRIHNAVHERTWSDPLDLNPNQKYTYQIEAFVDPDSTYSNTAEVYGTDCSNQPPEVTMTLRNNTTGVDAHNGDLPLPAKQNESVTLHWNVANATSCSASASPAQSYWTGSKTPALSSQPIPTTTPGTITFTLDCVNSNNVHTTPSVTLKVNQYPPAYFQTTGGDVHSNETIYITQ
jgi:hypothetical protein